MPSSRFLPMLVLAGALGPFLNAHPAGATIHSFPVTAAAYVNADRPTTGHGGARVLRVGLRPARRAFVRFRVADVGGSAHRATLLLFVARGSVPSVQVRRVGNGWREPSITWNRQPRPVRSAVRRGSPVRPGRWVAVDATPFVSGEGRYSFRITTRKAANVELTNSHRRRPRLEIETTPPSNIAPPQVLGPAEEGATLEVDPGNWSGSTPMAYAFQWQRCAEGACEDVAGATGQSYVLESVDNGSRLRVVTSASNAAGSSSATSPETAAVAPPSEPPTVTITGAPPDSTMSGSATLAWETSGTVASTQCQLDGGPVVDCASPASYASLGVGAHAFRVRVSNAAGSSADTASWVVTGDGVVWSADHETGDASEWPKITTRWDDVGCLEHAVVADGQAQSGRYAMKMTIDGLGLPKAGCRQARTAESQSGETYVYQVSYLLPQPVYPTNDMWNVFQFKSKCGACTTSDPMWTIGFERNPIRVVLNWKGGNYGLAGPFADSGVVANQEWVSDSYVPIGRWTTLTVLLDQSAGFDGHLTVWHDGVNLFDFADVRTQYPSLDARWSVNNYSSGLSVDPYTLYVDDASIVEP